MKDMILHLALKVHCTGCPLNCKVVTILVPLITSTKERVNTGLSTSTCGLWWFSMALVHVTGLLAYFRIEPWMHQPKLLSWEVPLMGPVWKIVYKQLIRVVDI